MNLQPDFGKLQIDSAGIARMHSGNADMKVAACYRFSVKEPGKIGIMEGLRYFTGIRVTGVLHLRTPDKRDTRGQLVSADNRANINSITDIEFPFTNGVPSAVHGRVESYIYYVGSYVP